jgi:multicomponent Na+:H+ antiporter subunit C
MLLILAGAVAVLFGAGVQLLLSRDLIRVVGGTVLISNAANLLLLAAGLGRGQAPIHPLAAGQPVSDPVVQALTLTSIVISFAISAFLLSLVYDVYATHRTLDFDDVQADEQADEAQQERRATP